MATTTSREGGAMKQNMERHSVTEENAPKFLKWIEERGGVAVWKSENLSNPGASWSTPARNEDGSLKTKPTWEASDKPEVYTSASDIDVYVDKEVKRFRVSLRMAGFTAKCTDASSRKIRSAVEKAGDGAYYVFDYLSQECVIMKPVSKVSLDKWAEDHK